MEFAKFMLRNILVTMLLPVVVVAFISRAISELWMIGWEDMSEWFWWKEE